MKFCRIQALFEELLIDWDKLNLSAKVLVYVGLSLIFFTIFISMYESKNLEIYEKIEVIFRTSLVSVFGFLLSSSTKSPVDKSRDSYKNTMTVTHKEKAITQDCKLTKEKSDYYYGEGNTIQVLVATLIAIISALVMLASYMGAGFNTTQGILISQFRDLMCTSIGFLLGEAKIKS